MDDGVRVDNETSTREAPSALEEEWFRFQRFWITGTLVSVAARIAYRRATDNRHQKTDFADGVSTAFIGVKGQGAEPPTPRKLTILPVLGNQYRFRYQFKVMCELKQRAREGPYGEDKQRDGGGVSSPNSQRPHCFVCYITCVVIDSDVIHVFVCLLKANYISQRISLRKSRRIRGL
jgi:hypothetical protein